MDPKHDTVSCNDKACQNYAIIGSETKTVCDKHNILNMVLKRSRDCLLYTKKETKPCFI